ncbi:hypothetical protein AYO42_00175 [Rhizomicrobium sp. SCGC AG-212-E05]|nr:hypothetical protein AYO42_00175 [Rhizomicrobium sp. SCGC AG-212-E05]
MVRQWSNILVGIVLTFTPTSVGAQIVQLPQVATLRYNLEYFASQNPKTALDLVNWLPGFAFSAGDSSVRGLSGSAGNVLIDDERPADKNFTLNQILQRIAVSQVEYVEVIRGSASNVDMLGQSVVANVVRKKTTADSGALSASQGYFLSGHHTPSLTLEGTHQDGQGRRFSGAVSLSKYAEASNGDGVEMRRNATGVKLGERAVNIAAGGWTGFAFGVFQTPAWQGQLGLNGNISWTDYNNRQLDQIHLPFPAVTDLREHLGGPLGGQLQGQVGMNFKRTFGERISSESVALIRLRGRSFTSRLTGPASTQFFSEKNHTGELTGRSTLRYQQASDLSFELGVEGTYNWLGTNSSFQFNAFPVTLPNANATVSEARGEGTAKLNWKVNPVLEVEGGIRLEASSIISHADFRRETSLFYPKPRLALTYTPTNVDQIRLRSERVVGQLDFSNYIASSALDTGFIRAGNVSILPQQEWTAEVAYEHRFWTSGAITATFRHSLISDAVDRVPIRNPANAAAAFDAPGNIGSGTQDVFIAALTLPLERLGLEYARIKASGTLQSSRVTDPTTGLKRGISNLSPGEYSIDFRQDWPEWRASWGMSLVTPCFASITAKVCTRSQYRFNEIDIFRADPALGVFAEYQPKPDLFWKVEASNILGADYRRAVNGYGGPRDLFPLSYVDDRWLESSPYVKISLRKTL